MSTLSKLAIAGTTAAGLVGLGYWRSTVIANEANKLETLIDAKMIGFNVSGFIIRLKVGVKNPSERAFDFSFPYIQLFYGKTPIGSSQPIQVVEEFPKGTEHYFGEELIITLRFSDLLFLGVQVLKDLKDGKAELKVGAKATTNTTIFGFVRHTVTYYTDLSIKNLLNNEPAK
jgi:hypothetical protein